jgi:tRNA U34 5-carboxymethylaminomethyl modifying GTPase MnmE/TrmE|tara:strand:- start:178 stop:474 length:297 start_codon:yes stop_codon:yes gene_type:complete
VANKKEEKTELLTKEQEKELQKMVENMLEIAANVVEEYGDLDLSELSELSGSLGDIVQINENSPFLDEIFEGDSWKKIIKNIPPIPKQPKDDAEDASD